MKRRILPLLGLLLIASSAVGQIHVPRGIHGALTVAASDASGMDKTRADYVCDGTADEVTINQAITALGDSGGKVLLSKGTFTIAAAIELTDDVWLAGQGNATQIVLEDSSDCDCITNAAWTAGNERIRVSDLYLDGNRTGQTEAVGDGPGQSLITYCNVTGGSITNVTGKSPILHGIDLAVEDIEDNTGDQSTSNIIVDNVEFWDFGDDGVTTHWADDCTITKAICHDGAATYSTSSNGIEIDDGSDSILVSSSTCYANARGIQVQGHTGRTPAQNVSIVNCNVHDNDGNMWLIYGVPKGDADPRGVSVFGCVFSGTGEGIIVQNYSGVTVSGCVFKEVYGMICAGAGGGTYKNRNIQFTNNVVIGNGALLPTRGVQFLNVSGKSNQEVEEVVIANNLFDGVRYQAVYLESLASAFTVSNNIIRNCGFNNGGTGAYAIDVNADNIGINDNQLISNSAAIYVRADAADVRIRGNYILAAGNSGVRAQGDMIDIVGNTIDTGTGYAVHLPASETYTRLRIQGNDLTGSAVAIRNDAAITIPSASAFVADNHGVTSSVALFNDNQQLVFGAAGATDSYLQWDGSELDVYSSAGINLGSSNTTTTGTIEGTGLILGEKSADPADPAEGKSIIWQSDGTGAGDDGDIMIKITAGATTKTVTLVDFSAF